MIHTSDILKARILIVDDQQANVTLLAHMLRGAGYSAVDSTTDPGQTCPLHLANHYSLILLDLQMPGLDGFQVMEELKAIETGSYLPVVVITAQPNHKLRALKAGARDFVSKPFDLAEVLMRVHNMLEVRLLQQQAELRTGQAEAQFIEAQKMEVIGRLASGVAHDFNNLLAVILGYGCLIETIAGEGGPVKKYAEQIRHASDRAAGLTRQLLLFSRKETVQPVVLNLDEVIKELDKMLRPLIGENIDLTIVAGAQFGRVKADSGYVGQLIMNLVVNARDAMPNGGKLTIATQNVLIEADHSDAPHKLPAGRYVMLSVTDNGVGMTEEVKDRLFEAFFTTKPKGKGTGLGLATCQTIAQLFGCHIAVLSELGKGTAFNIYFPQFTQPLFAASKPRLSGVLPRGTETLLIVEDEPVLRLLACTILESHGYHVLTATNGQDAMNVARNHTGAPIGLVLTDVIMPVMGGNLMAEWFVSTYPQIKILFTSGYTDETVAQNGAPDSFVAFLPKPYEPGALVRKVRELLDAEDKEHTVCANDIMSEVTATVTI